MIQKSQLLFTLSALGLLLSACSFPTTSSWLSSVGSTEGCDSCTTNPTTETTSSEDESIPSTSLPTSHSGSSYLSDDGEFTYAYDTLTGGYTIVSYGGNATSIVIPNQYEQKPVLALGDYLFYQNASILNVTLPGTLEKIGIAAFKGCTQLYSIELPSSLAILGTDAFSGCSQLSSVTYSNLEASALATLGNNAFEGTAIAHLDLPASLMEIHSRTFADCAYLGQVDFYGSTPPVRADNSFEGCPSGLSFYVPANALTAYQSAPSWSAYTTHLYNR